MLGVLIAVLHCQDTGEAEPKKVPGPAGSKAEVLLGNWRREPLPATNSVGLPKGCGVVSASPDTCGQACMTALF